MGKRVHGQLAVVGNVCHGGTRPFPNVVTPYIDSPDPRWKVWWSWLAVVVWMGLIFSASTGGLSAAHTSRFIEPLLRWLFQGRLGEDAVGKIHFLIRKLAHLAEYAILAVLIWNALRLSLAGASMRGVFARLAVLVSMLYAASDEFHQAFVPGREAAVRDVLIDTAGAIGGLGLLAGVKRLSRQRKLPVVNK